jgi:hypothetical protein
MYSCKNLLVKTKESFFQLIKLHSFVLANLLKTKNYFDCTDFTFISFLFLYCFLLRQRRLPPCGFLCNHSIQYISWPRSENCEGSRIRTLDCWCRPMDITTEPPHPPCLHVWFYRYYAIVHPMKAHYLCTTSQAKVSPVIIYCSQSQNY